MCRGYFSESVNFDCLITPKIITDFDKIIWKGWAWTHERFWQRSQLFFVDSGSRCWNQDSLHRNLLALQKPACTNESTSTLTPQKNFTKICSLFFKYSSWQTDRPKT